MSGLLFCKCPDFPLIMFIISIHSICGSVVNLTLRFGKIISRTIFSILSIYIYSIALTPATCVLSLMVFQIWCHSLTKNVPLWLPTILILLSNDIHLNPGPNFQNNFFQFHDLISICETSLNDSVELPETLMTIHLCLPTIQQMLDMVGLASSLRILFLL